jgi:hypothetical protein
MVPTGELEGHANSLRIPEGPLPGQATTSLTSEQFEELVARVAQRVEWSCGRGRPKGLTLPQAVKAVVMYFRTNITEELIAELLFVDQSTISRVISDLEGVIAEALDEFVPDLAEETNGRVGVVERSLCPCWSWADAPELYSGKHKTTGHAHQFVAGLSGDLMHISDPLPGKVHDAKASATPASPTSSPATTLSATKATSAPALPRHTANRPAESFSTGRRNSIPRSTRFAT